MAPPTEIRAVITQKVGEAAVQTVPLPRLRDDYVLVRTTAVGLNPTDWKTLDGAFGDSSGTKMGLDFAGIVEEVGPKVTKPFAKGDRITGVVHGSNQSEHEDGAFGEYLVVKGDVAIKVPDNVTDEEAATLGVGISTVAQGLYQALKLPLPESPAPAPFPILIYGGSTATGVLGIQFAKLSGARVATTCSPRNFELAKSMGADAVFDYNSPTVLEDIKAWDSNIQHAWDCVVTPESTALTVGAMAESGGQYGALLFPDDVVIKAANPNVTSSVTLMYTIFGEAFKKGPRDFPAIPGELELGKKFWELTRQLLAEGKLKTARPDVNRGGKGLEGVLVGLQELKHNKVSGVKLVYTL
ncbi:GroES-like protein [Thozetella sp. PMI_491]|nr:GroES-like protein [Thozetella sp. PMI_491]